MPKSALVSSVQAAVEELLTHDNRNPTIRIVARTLSISPRSLQRHLHDVGVNYRDMVLRTRLDLARRMLAGNRLSIEEISWELGYKDPSSFSRFFVRMTGVTPRAYRRQCRSARQS